ncbi:MAG: hypothetical protein ACT4PG_03930 [Panacagrimonas sp.]
MSTQTLPLESIRGATGLSRAALAAWFRRAGLFGPESALNAAEQAVVQNELGPIAGLRGRPLLAPIDTRLQVLAVYARELMATGGVETAEDVAQLVDQGYSRSAAREVARLIRDVREVFGLQPRGSDAWLATLTSPALQNAA